MPGPTRPIVFAIDDRYIKPLAVALAGLLRHGRGRRKIYLFHTSLSPLHQLLLRRWLRTTPLDLSIEAIPPRHRIRHLPHHFSPAILLRLSVAPRIREPEFIYLDADILVMGDPAAIDRVPLDGAIIAASPHPPSGPAEREPCARPYYGTGLMVIDARRFEAESIGQRALALIAGNAFAYPDQDALNLICPPSDWRALPEGLNVEVGDLTPADGGTPPGAVDRPEGAIVLQLAGSEKPWHLWNRHPLRSEFRDVLARTPFSLLPFGPADIRWRSLLSRLRRRVLLSVRALFRSGTDQE